jgi:hypothetical protein
LVFFTLLSLRGKIGAGGGRYLRGARRAWRKQVNRDKQSSGKKRQSHFT